MTIEVRYDRSGNLKRVVAKKVFVCLELIEDNHWWLCVGEREGEDEVSIHFWTERTVIERSFSLRYPKRP